MDLPERRHCKGGSSFIGRGQLPDEFVLYGAETFICASRPLTEGRFIAFLKKDGDLWTGSNGHLSLRPIKDASVDWYVADDNRCEMKPTALDKVLSEIKTTTANKRMQATGVPPVPDP